MTRRVIAVQPRSQAPLTGKLAAEEPVSNRHKWPIRRSAPNNSPMGCLAAHQREEISRQDVISFT